MPDYIQIGGPSATPRQRLRSANPPDLPGGASAWLQVADGYAAADAIPARWLVVEPGGVRVATTAEQDAQVVAYRAERIVALVAEVNAYGAGRGYDPDTEHRLAIRREEAARLGLTNRAALIDSVLAWRDSVMGHYATARAALAAATTVSAVDAVTWDFSQFDATDPGVTVTDVLAVPD